MKRYVKKRANALFIRFLQQTDAVQEGDRQFLLRHKHLPQLPNQAGPYAGLGEAASGDHDKPAIFITGRFRSGSTLLWNLFRQLDGCTAYYEPFNERQWFNPVLRGEGVDKTHRGVDDYWREYESMEQLAQWYREEWIREGLFMDEQSYDPMMQRYIQELIAAAQGTAVLQFNRVDFRLPWLRRHFPTVPIVHLYRHPRDQWLSFLADPLAMGPDTVEYSYRDGFYLDAWCADLSQQFPFLNRRHTPHPYRRFYYLWKLSWLFGQCYATTSVRFEDLVTQPQPTLEALLHSIAWPVVPDWSALISNVLTPPLERWREYAPEDWFTEHESACETVLNNHLPQPSSQP